MLTLHLIRHAKTEESSITGKDIDRKLMEKGIAQANVLGHSIRTHHTSLGKILCSSARRTKQTHSIISQHIPNQIETSFIEELYLADERKILQTITNYGGADKTVTIIGHNNGLSYLASALSGERIHLRTAEMVSMTFPFETWDMVIPDTGVIIFQMRPQVFLP